MKVLLYILSLVLISSCGKSEQKNSTSKPESVTLAQNQTPITFTSIGAPSCGEWYKTNEEKENGDFPYEWEKIIQDYKLMSLHSWLTGYLSGVNSSTPGTVDFLQHTDADSLYLYVDNYCREHPLDSVSVAADALYVELRMK